MSDTKLGIIIGLSVLISLFVVPLVLTLTRSKKYTQQQATTTNTSTVPSVYTVRANNLFLARRRMIPRLIMWGVVLGAVCGALYLFDPHMFMWNVRAVGPTIGIALMGFGVLGIGQSMEETYESYEFSKLGWGGAIVLWIMAAVLLFK